MEKSDFSLERCGHSSCMGGRTDYCGAEAENPVIDAAIVSEKLNSVLYDMNNNPKVVRGGDFDGRVSRTTASFSSMDISQGSGLYDPAEANIEAVHSINHENSSETYGVESSWRVPGNTMDVGWIATKYLVSMSPKGEVTAMVNQVNVTTGEYETEKMTHYDWLQLQENIGLLDSSGEVSIDIDGS